MPEKVYLAVPPKGLVVWSDEEDSSAMKLADRLGVPYLQNEEPPGPDAGYQWLFFYEEGALFLHSYIHEEFDPICVDFFSSEMQRRVKSFSRNDLLAKAIGVKKGVHSVLDATCGLGTDAFLLSTLKELEITTCERNIVVSELVADAFLRVKDTGMFENNPIHFHYGDAASYLQTTTEKFDTIYLDPMFPREKDKSAKQKKEMLLFRELAGEDLDAEKLFALAMQNAKKRVVVKRPDDAPKITLAHEPDIVFPGKAIRFDVYLIK